MAALVTAAGGSLLTAAPALADDLFGAITTAGGVQAVQDNGDGTNSVDNSTANVSTIRLGNSRTIIDIGFNLPPTKTLNVIVNDASDIVEFRSAGAGTISGTVNSYVGSLTGPRGGNVWFSYPGGVTVSATGLVNVGGLLVTTAQVTDADFLGTDLSYAFTATSGLVADFGHVTGNGSLVGFVAPSLSQVAGSIVDGGTAGPEVLFGASNNYMLTLAAKTSGGYDLLSYVPAATTASTLSLAGTTTAASLFVAGTKEPTLTGSTLTVNGAEGDGDGDIAITPGYGLSRTVATDPMRVTPLTGAATQSLTVDTPLTAGRDLLLAPTRNLTLRSPVSGDVVGLSTGRDGTSGTFSRLATATVTAQDHWVVYAENRVDVPTDTTALLSTQQVIWDSDVAASPPRQVSGNRYVFGFSPQRTFTADNVSKEAGDAVTLTDYSADGGPEAAVPGVYPADPPFTGAPSLTSDGAAADAAWRANPYPINITQGTLDVPAGYNLTFVPGLLTINDSVKPTVGTATGTLAGGGSYTAGSWTNKDVTVSWTCTDAASGPVETPRSRTVSSTTTVTPDCADNAGNIAAGPTFQVNIDKVAPALSGMPADQTLTTTGTAAVATWTNPTATDNQDQSPTVACAPASGSSFNLGTTTVTCSATDDAGNVTSQSFTVTVNQATQQQVVVRMQAPIDAAPVMNTARIFRILPVRLTFTVNGRAITGTSPQPLYVGTPTRVSCSVASRNDAIETFASSRTTGNLFRWNTSLRRWVYNFDQRAFGLQVGDCYRVPVFYGGSVVRNEASGGSQVGFFYLRSLR